MGFHARIHRPLAILVMVMVTALTLSAPTLAAPSGSKNVRKAARLFQKGERSMQAGQLDGARANFSSALEAAPGFPQALIGMGHVSMAESAFEDALGHYRSARDGFADYGEDLFDVENRRYGNARDQIQQLNDSILQLRNMAPAEASIRISQLENRISQLEAVEPPDRATLGQPPAELDFYIGNALFQLGRTQEAVDAWTECALRKPGYALVYNNLALGYWKLGRIAEAQESLAKAEELGFPVDPRFKADLKAAGDRKV